MPGGRQRHVDVSSASAVASIQRVLHLHFEPFDLLLPERTVGVSLCFATITRLSTSFHHDASPPAQKLPVSQYNSCCNASPEH
eukprot:2525763-Rhodomonas_salina.4